MCPPLGWSGSLFLGYQHMGPHLSGSGESCYPARGGHGKEPWGAGLPAPLLDPLASPAQMPSLVDPTDLGTGSAAQSNIQV